jgi:hypothetical protein
LLAGLALRAIQVYACQGAAGLGALLGVALLQAACFGGLFVRSLWLASCLACTERDRASGQFG